MLHQIGIGTLGPVFRTYEPTRDRLVAVKVFRLDIVPEQAQALAAALSRAVRASLLHPSIVEPIDAGVEGTLAYRAEEYVAAESLDVAMRHYAPAPIEKVLPFITQLSGAIDFARATGIGHGGLHPRDIFVTPDEARATGFGVVEALEQVGIRAPIRRPYSAPERIDGGAWSTPADVFALAAITFELLTSKRPAGTGPQIGTLPDGAHASALQTVLSRAMDDDPAKRYVSALAFAGALEAASQGRPLTDAVTPVLAIAGREGPVAGREERVADPIVVAATPPVLTPAEVEPEPAGELEIEAQLDPLHETLAKVSVEEAETPAAPLLFAHEDVEVHEPVQARFADDFVEEQEAEADTRSPIEDTPPYPAPAAMPAEAAMFQASEPEVDVEAAGERGRPAILPYAVVSVLMLLIGFGAGYFLGSRDRLVTPQEAAQTAAPAAPKPSAAAPAAGPATADKAGQYSEQKVATPSPAAPPVKANDTAAATPPPTTASIRPTPPPATPREPVAEKGQIVVHSVPSHAGVTVNGTWRGRTPLTLDNLAFGAYSIRVVQPGYVVARDEFALNARAPSRTFTARLEPTGPVPPPPAAAPAASAAPASVAGSLYVDSRPRGATVTVDGRSVGQTPVSLPDMSAGTHVVRIEMDGKKPVTATPRVVAGKLERVTVSLEDKQ